MQKQSSLHQFTTHFRSAVISSNLNGKLFCVLFIIGYILSLSQRSFNALTVTVGRVTPPNFWIWTLFTHSFIEIRYWHTIFDIIIVLLFSKVVETIWSTRETIKFYFVATIPSAFSLAFVHFFRYGLTFNEEFLFNRPIYGAASFFGAYSVVLKQIMPETIIVALPFLKLKQDQIPLLAVFLTVVVWLLNGVPADFVIMLTFGIFTSWVYLRFFQIHDAGASGDSSSAFSFASFFPSSISPIISVLSNTIFEILVKLKLCQPFVKKSNIAIPSSILITIPGPEAADAERRKQKALRALEDRMKAKETTNESWPEIEETNPVEKNKPNLADIHSNSTITTSQHDKIESTQVYLNDEQTTDDNQ